MDCVKQMMAKEGPLSVYNGISAHVCRNAGWNGAYFALIGTARNWFPVKPDDNKGMLLLAGISTPPCEMTLSKQHAVLSWK